MAAKKSFKSENPAMRFISPLTEAVELEQPASPDPSPSKQELPSPASPWSAPEPPAHDVPMKMNPLYIETRSRRLNLLIQPSLHKRIKSLASARHTSVNDLIHLVLEEYADREGAKRLVE